MLGFINQRTLNVWLVCLNVFQIVKSVDDLPPCNFTRNILLINALNIKVENVSRYFCFSGVFFQESSVKLRDKVLNDDQNVELESQDGDVKCVEGYGENGFNIIFKSQTHQTRLFDNDFII